MTPEMAAVESFRDWLSGLPLDLQGYVILAPAALVLVLIGWAFDRKVRFDGGGWPFGVHYGSPEPAGEEDDAWVDAAEDAVDEAARRRP